jgi:peptide/nickel transport system substrate-binding protein
VRLEEALDVSQIDDLNQAAQPWFRDGLARLGEGVALLVARPAAAGFGLSGPSLPEQNSGAGPQSHLVAALRPEGRSLRLEGLLAPQVLPPDRFAANALDADQVVAALLSGDVDMLTDLPTQDIARLRQDSKLKVVDGPEVRTIYLAPDMGSPELKHSNIKGKNPFADKRVRQALSMAIDREAIKRNIMRGLSIPAGLMVAPGVNGHSPELDTPIKTDVEGAKKLLADAGYPNGLEVRLNCPNNRYVNDEEICQAVVAMWARVGVKATLAAENMATFIQKVQNFDSSIYLLGWGVATYDAQYSLQSLIRTRTTGADGNFNFSKISDPVVDRLTDAMKTETDVTKRNAMIREALVRTRDEVLVIPLHHQMRPWAMKAGVTTLHRSDDRPEARFTSIR